MCVQSRTGVRVQSISTEGKECPRFSSNQSAEDLLMSMTEKLSLMKLYVPLTCHFAPAFHMSDDRVEDGAQ